MKLRLGKWQLTIGPRDPAPERVYITRGPRMDETELTAAFANATDQNKLWVAINQQLDTLAENCSRLAWLFINEPTRALGYVAMSEALMQLRDDFEARRKKALPARRKLRIPREDDSQS